MSEKKQYGVKEIITNKIDPDAFIPGDVYLIKTDYMSEAKLAIHEYTTEYQVSFLLPNKQAMKSNKYRTIISIDELIDGSATIEPALSYSKGTYFMKWTEV